MATTAPFGRAENAAPFDERVLISLFAGKNQPKAQEKLYTPPELVQLMREERAPSKDRMRLIKFALFRQRRRSTDNITGHTGAEVEHDRETMPFATALEILTKAGIECILSTTASHRLLKNGVQHGDRWRVYTPYSRVLSTDEHLRIVGRLAGLLRDAAGTVLSPESWTAAQAYYFGTVEGQPPARVVLLKGKRIDHEDFAELDLIALAKPETSKHNGAPADDPEDAGPHTPGADPRASIADIAAALAATPNDWTDWNQWNVIGMAIWRASEGSDEGFDAWVQWSEQNPNFDLSAAEERWAHYPTSPPNDLGYGSLVYWARQHDPDFVPPSKRKRAALVRIPRHQRGGGGATAWPVLDPAAMYGLAGEIATIASANSEADPVAILVQVLAMAGCVAGRSRYCQIGDTQHSGNLFVVLVGTTAKGRKGTSYNPVQVVFREADHFFVENCIKHGLVSGEGVIHHLRDEVVGFEKVKRSGKKDEADAGTREVVKSPGIEDKRLLVVEEEFAHILAVMDRAGVTLSPVLRLLWDGHKLQTLGKTSGETATGAHGAVIGHITDVELVKRLGENEQANGFGNRFLFALVRRSKELPLPKALDRETVRRLGGRLREVLFEAPVYDEIEFDASARELWIKEYHQLSKEKPPSLYGFLTARGEAQVRRLALVYTILDGAPKTRPVHLKAALALWRYCEQSVKYVFNDLTGDPMADEVLEVLREAGKEGCSGRELHDLFQHHSKRLEQALKLLQTQERVTMRREQPMGPQGGRPREIWTANGVLSD